MNTLLWNCCSAVLMGAVPVAGHGASIDVVFTTIHLVERDRTQCHTQAGCGKQERKERERARGGRSAPASQELM